MSREERGRKAGEAGSVSDGECRARDSKWRNIGKKRDDKKNVQRPETNTREQ